MSAKSYSSGISVKPWLLQVISKQKPEIASGAMSYGRGQKRLHVAVAAANVVRVWVIGMKDDWCHLLNVIVDKRLTPGNRNGETIPRTQSSDD